MQDLRFYNFEFTLLHIEHDFSSVYWSLKYNGIGTFEAEFALKDSLNGLCSDERYLIVCQGDNQAIITGRQIKNNKLKLYGRTVNFILSKRALAPFSTEKLDIKKDSASLAQYIINEACPDFISLGSSVDAEEGSELERTSMSPVSDIICDCLERDGLGHRVVFDTVNKKWVFDILKGDETKLIISEDMLNAFDSEYTHSMLDFSTSGYYYRKYIFKGDWDPTLNSPFLYDNVPENYSLAYRAASDADYFNLDIKQGDYLVCSSESGKWEKSDKADGFWVYIEGRQKGAYRWDEVIYADTESEALELLEKKQLTEKGSAHIRNLEFGKDFKLGDIVTFSQRMGNEAVSIRLRITSVALWLEQGSAMGVKPEFTQI